MKKQLLLGSALLAAISAFPQNGRTKAQPSMVDIAQKVARKYQVINRPVETASPFQAPASTNAKTAAVTSNTNNLTIPITTWNGFTGSENVYGMLVSNSKPLQYNDELGRVSFVHRKSHTYSVIPAAAATASTGVVTAEITNNWGLDWDSTALWADDAHWGRYPQGGIYNPVGNTNAKNAYIVGTGPVTQAVTALGWVGNWFASRQLDTMGGPLYNNNVQTNSQLFIANSFPYNNIANGKIDFARLDFSATDDGVVRSLGLIYRDANNTTSASLVSGSGYRGAKIAKGTFDPTNHNFTWSFNDSIIPPVDTNHVSGNKRLFQSPHMAWNESGSIGYIWHIGQRIGTTGNNIGYQPIVYKSVDHGSSWTLIPNINFNTAAMAHDVLRWIPGNDTDTIPLFNNSADMDGIVDANGKLHIVSTLLASSKSHRDSIDYSFQFHDSNDGETYTFGHVPGLRPYIFDFVGDGTGVWQALMIDSMSTEAPGTAAGDDGVDSNPWDKDPETNDKVDISARIQLSRTADGKHIVYTWADTDTLYNTNYHNWNIAPNVRARMLTVTNSGMTLHPTQINITDPPTNQFAPVRGLAYNHYISPKCALSTLSTGNNDVAIFLPITISSNPQLFQREPMTHYYSSAILNFDNVSNVQPPYGPDTRNGQYVGIATNALNSTRNSVIYPNPAKGSAVLSIDLKDNASNVQVSVMNMVGQQVKSNTTAAQIGQNNINVDLSGLTQGIYMVNVKVGTASSTKKLVVE